jgi:hypothetical protein
MILFETAGHEPLLLVGDVEQSRHQFEEVD